MKIACLASAAVLATSISVAGAGVRVDVEYPDTEKSFGVGANAQAGVALFDALAQMLIAVPSYARPYVAATLLLEMLRDFAETVSAIDAVSIDFTKRLADVTAAADFAFVSFSKALADESLSQDGASVAFSKALADSAPSIDAFGVLFEKRLADATTATDEISISVVPADFTVNGPAVNGQRVN